MFTFVNMLAYTIKTRFEMTQQITCKRSKNVELHLILSAYPLVVRVVDRCVTSRLSFSSQFLNISMSMLSSVQCTTLPHTIYDA